MRWLVHRILESSAYAPVRGQQQRVAIARSLVHKPKILVCDEPTSALDHHTGEKIIEMMKNMQKKLGTTFVIVTHDNSIFKYADRIAKMDDGTIVDVQIASEQEIA